MREHVAECLKGRSALVALSGGVDSVVLLHLLLSLGARVVAAHVEHGIRGENSRRDCAFVQEMCRARGVMLTLTHLDVPAEARRRGTGLEETAREMRYAFLRRADGAVLAEAETAWMYIDMATGRAIRVPDDLRHDFAVVTDEEEVRAFLRAAVAA